MSPKRTHRVGGSWGVFPPVRACCYSFRYRFFWGCCLTLPTSLMASISGAVGFRTAASSSLEDGCKASRGGPAGFEATPGLGWARPD